MSQHIAPWLRLASGRTFAEALGSSDGYKLATKLRSKRLQMGCWRGRTGSPGETEHRWETPFSM